jgi:hypothetical protein
MNEYYDGEWTPELQACGDLSLMCKSFANCLDQKELHAALALLSLQPQADELLAAIKQFHAHLEEQALRLTSVVH